MKVVITGGGGFIGSRLARKLLKKGTVENVDGDVVEFDKLVLFDVAVPEMPEHDDARVETVTGDICDPQQVKDLLGGDTNNLFHLAAVPSGGAEENFDLGMKVNLDGTRNLLEAARAQDHLTKFLFASTIAVYGGPEAKDVVDETIPMPETSYGMQKIACEYMVRDYNRRGFIDGRSMRLPAISIRAGEANTAASGYASGIFREPLNGVDAIIPVRPETRLALLSPRKVVDAFIHLNALESGQLGDNRTILLSGLTVAMEEAEPALKRVAHNRKLGEIKYVIDDQMQKISDGWPDTVQSARAKSLGFEVDANVDEIIHGYIVDELE